MDKTTLQRALQVLQRPDDGVRQEVYCENQDTITFTSHPTRYFTKVLLYSTLRLDFEGSTKDSLRLQSIVLQRPDNWNRGNRDSDTTLCFSSKGWKPVKGTIPLCICSH